MKISEQFKQTFRDTDTGTEFTKADIVQEMRSRFGTNESSIIPSDYCYNRLNNGIDFTSQMHLFEYTSDKTYRYLGENAPYSGPVFHKPKGCPEICVGHMKNGIFTLNPPEN